MTVIPEEKLIAFLRSCLSLSQRALAEISSGSRVERASAELLRDFSEFLTGLLDERKNDTRLADDSWEWVWKDPADMNPIQVYGRLAWINYRLLDFL